jgi:hypothetical protein
LRGLRRRAFRIPDGVDRVISVRPSWIGTQGDLGAGYMVVRIWYDGRVEEMAGPLSRTDALTQANRAAAAEGTVMMRAPDDQSLRGSALLFGELPAIRPGQTFHRRVDLQRAGMFRSLQQGIDFTSEGAVAIVFSGGYVDDEWSDEDPWYTGEGGQDKVGGRQIHDQELVRGNLALTRNLRTGLPVRVIRKVERDDGDYDFMYEGLFHVVDQIFSPGRDGPKVYRFRLRRATT